MAQRETIRLYTDGACSGNPGAGGYGVVLCCGSLRKELSGGFSRTTNNRMELLAVIIGLEQIKWEQADVLVTSDSSYVVNAISQGWLERWAASDYVSRASGKKTTVKNRDLWERLRPLLQRHQVRFEWVKGHNGHPENERCDQLAVAASKQPGLTEDTGYINE
ncbi:MAG: ribonuclease HI [Bacteroidales bacterium]|nr:ribonuclease HI [Bacteroidales bacterium]